MLLQYVAFFFAVPELLGDSRLKLLNKWITNIVFYIPKITIAVLSTFVGILMGIWGSYIGVNNNYLYVKLFYSVVILSVVLVIILSIFQKKIIAFLNNRIAIPLATKLTENSDYRLAALKYAALLYSLGLLILIFTIIYF